MSRITASPLTVTLAALLAFLIVEFQFNFLERGIGAYLDHHNAEHARLAKFVDRETRNIEAQRKLETLIDQRSHQPDHHEAAPAPVGPSEFVELDNGHKLVMTRGRFTAACQKLGQTPNALSQSSHLDDTLRDDQWTKAILVRGGWLRKGHLFLVDDKNRTLFEASLSTEQFALLKAYGEAGSSQIDRVHIRVYTPQTFFTALRTLPDPMREQIISRDRSSYLEAHASRVGISDANSDGLVQVIVETINDERLDYISVTPAEDAIQELLKALGGSSTGAVMENDTLTFSGL